MGIYLSSLINGLKFLLCMNWYARNTRSRRTLYAVAIIKTSQCTPSPYSCWQSAVSTKKKKEEERKERKEKKKKKKEENFHGGNPSPFLAALTTTRNNHSKQKTRFFVSHLTASKANERKPINRPSVPRWIK